MCRLLLNVFAVGRHRLADAAASIVPTPVIAAIALMLLTAACAGQSIGDLWPLSQPAAGEGTPGMPTPPPSRGRTAGTPLPPAGSPDVPADVTLAMPGAVTPYAWPARRQAALLVPLTGANAALGAAMVNAAQLALFDVGNDDIELRPYDTAGTPEGAYRAALAATDDGADIVLGPVFSPDVAAVARAISGRVPVLAFSSDRSVAGPGVYTLGLFPGEQVARVASYALERGRTRFAALLTNDAMGRIALDALQRTLAARGGTLVRVEWIDPRPYDLPAVVKRLANYDARQWALKQRVAELKAQEQTEEVKRELETLKNQDTLGELDYDALLVPFGGDLLSQVAPLLPYYDIDPREVQILGLALWDVPGLGAEPGLVGGWYAAPPPDARADFEQRYRRVYGNEPPRLATLAYDAMALAAHLTRTNPASPYAAPMLQARTGYLGLDGAFRLRPDGTVERNLAVIEVRPRGTRVVNTAGTRFVDLSN